MRSDVPLATFRIKSVSGPERRQNRYSKQWFKVWTVDREPDDALPMQDSLAGYQTSNAWVASLCERARDKQLPVTVLWKQSPWLRDIVEITLAPDGVRKAS